MAKGRPTDGRRLHPLVQGHVETGIEILSGSKKLNQAYNFSHRLTRGYQTVVHTIRNVNRVNMSVFVPPIFFGGEGGDTVFLSHIY